VALVALLRLPRPSRRGCAGKSLLLHSPSAGEEVVEYFDHWYYWCCSPTCHGPVGLAAFCSSFSSSWWFLSPRFSHLSREHPPSKELADREKSSQSVRPKRSANLGHGRWRTSPNAEAVWVTAKIRQLTEPHSVGGAERGIPSAHVCPWDASTNFQLAECSSGVSFEVLSSTKHFNRV
jgi:hypothetical protein